jgi:hypothetical protein
MGYHITLERSDSSNPITAEEWEAFVEQHPELMWLPADGIDLVGSDKSFHSVMLDKDQEMTLHCSDGRIWTKAPSPRLISYLVSIADHFKGTVRGSEGEVYATQADCPTEEDWNMPVPLKSFWKREFTLGNIIRMSLPLGVLIMFYFKHRYQHTP